MRVSMAILAAALMAACGGDLRPVKGSTLRVSRPEVADGTELALKIFTDPYDCGRLKPADQPLCMPRVDRASGEVHLAFQFFLGSDVWPMPITEEHIQVAHQGSIIQEGENQQRLQIIPHDPLPSTQLFVVLIDGSGSMNMSGRDAVTPIEKVREALLLPEVVSAFFPPDVRTGVVLLEFSSGKPRPVGGELKVITDRRAYRRLVRESLRASGGYTHLYDAIRYATGELLEREEPVRQFLLTTSSTPTIIALTDGFNNERTDDTCASNARRLQRLLDDLEAARAPEVDLKTRPEVFTVGLGRPFHPRFKLPGKREKVTDRRLCRKGYDDQRIDGHLEMYGIDNASLEWIASVGGGTSYVRQGTGGLGEAFRAAATDRYTWFELAYQLDPFYLRRSFKTTVRLTAFADAEASVTLHPSAWLDPPPGRKAEDGWTRKTTVARTATFVMPALGLLVTLAFLAPAWFNMRRVLMGRWRPVTRRGKSPPRGGGPKLGGNT